MIRIILLFKDFYPSLQGLKFFDLVHLWEIQTAFELLSFQEAGRCQVAATSSSIIGL